MGKIIKMKRKKFTPEQLQDLEQLHYLHDKLMGDLEEDNGLDDDEADEYDQLCDKIGNYLPIDGF